MTGGIFSSGMIHTNSDDLTVYVDRFLIEKKAYVKCSLHMYCGHLDSVQMNQIVNTSVKMEIVEVTYKQKKKTCRCSFIKTIHNYLITPVKRNASL